MSVEGLGRVKSTFHTARVICVGADGDDRRAFSGTRRKLTLDRATISGACGHWRRPAARLSSFGAFAIGRGDASLFGALALDQRRIERGKLDAPRAELLHYRLFDFSRAALRSIIADIEPFAPLPWTAIGSAMSLIRSSSGSPGPTPARGEAMPGDDTC